MSMDGQSGVAFVFYTPLTTTGTQDQQTNPTIAAGDFQVSTDGSAFTNLDTLPTVTPAGGNQVKITLSIAEMTGTVITVKAVDQAGDEWEDDFWEIRTDLDATVRTRSAPGDAMDLVANAVDSTSLAASAVIKIWQEILTGASYTTANMAGKLLRNAAQSQVISDGTAQAGAAGQITLKAGSSLVDGFYRQCVVTIVGGTGEGQSRYIYAYTGSSKIAKTIPAWDTVPDATSDYTITPVLVHSETSAECLLSGYATGATSTSITLDSDASSIDDFYVGSVVVLHHNGAAAGQARRIVAYDGTSKVAVVHSSWKTTPSVGTQYAIKSGITYVPALSGAHTITVTVEDGSSNPVQGVRVDVYDSTNTYYVGSSDPTDAAGQTTLLLDTDDYKLRLVKNQFTPTNNPESISVSADASVTYTGTVFTAPSAGSPDECTIYGFLRDGAGNLQEGKPITFWATTPQTLDDAVLTSEKVTVRTEKTGGTKWGNGPGYFQIDLTRLGVVRRLAPSAGIDDSKTVPNTGNQDWKDW